MAPTRGTRSPVRSGLPGTPRSIAVVRRAPTQPRTRGVTEASIASADIPEKHHAVAGALAQVAASLDGHERDQLVQVVSMLVSRYTLWRLKDEFGLTADQAAGTVAWAIAMLARGVQCPVPPASA